MPRELHRAARASRFPCRQFVGSLVRRAAVAAAVLAVAVLPAAADRWYEHYDRAERALAQERWAVAVSELNEALARRGDSAAAVRSYGLNVVAYFPYLRLGQAYYQLGRYDAALAALETEERLGAIRESRDDMATLVALREKARSALGEAGARAGERAKEATTRALAEAQMLAEAGRLDEAMNAVSRALAVDPGNPDARSRMEALRRRSVEESDAARQRQEGAALAGRARTAFEAGDLAGAASLLRRALELRDDAADRRLLQQVEAAVRDAAASSQSAGLVEGALAEALRREAAGDFDGAGAELGRMLALAPSDARVAALAARLAEKRRKTRATEELTGDLAAARKALDEGRWDAGIAAANRALARDATNRDAADLVSRAYRELNRLVLGGAETPNLPPAIRFTNRRDVAPGAEPVEITDDARFQLSGVVVDATPVRLAARDQRDQPIDVTTAVQAVGGLYLTEFRLGLELAPGDTAIALTATDAETVSSRSEFRVRYERPVWRSPWTAAAGALAIGAIGAAVVAVRSARQRGLRRRRFNPYVAGAPVLDEGMLYGRAALVDRILQTVHTNSLLLHGERRIGKTSLQHHLKRRLEHLDDPEYRFFPVYVDLQGTAESRFFATLATEIFAELGPRLGGLGPGTPLDGAYGDRELAADLRAVIARLATTTHKRVKLVLLIDEVDELNAYDPRTNQRLRALFMQRFSENLAAVVSGVRIRRDWAQEASPWYNFFEEVEVSAIDHEHAARLVTEPVRGVIAFDDDAVRAIVERTGGRPYAIQRLCMGIVQRLHEQGRARATLADVEAVALDREAAG